MYVLGIFALYILYHIYLLLFNEMDNIDLNGFVNLNDTDVESKIVELVRELDILIANNPTISFECLTEKLGSLIHTFDSTYESIKIISASNGRLKDEINDLKTHLDVSKLNMQNELEKSFELQDNIVEENKLLVQQLSELKLKLAKLQEKFYVNISENISLKALLSDVNENAVDQSSYDRIMSENSELKSKISFKDASISMLKNKLEVLKNQNIELSSKIDISKFEIDKLKAGNWNSGRWVEDSILQSYYDSFMAKEKSKSCKALFIGPSLSELLKNGLPCDIKQQILDTDLRSYNYAFCCVNDNTQTEAQDGASHWSLLFLDISRHTAFHLDSVTGLNSKFALKLAGNLGFDCCLEVPCVQQSNSFECGLNLLVNSIIILNGYCHPVPDSRKPFIDWFSQFANGSCRSADHLTPLETDSNLTTSMTTNVRIPNSSSNQSDTWKVVKYRSKCGVNNCKETPSTVMTNNKYSVLSTTPDLVPDPQTVVVKVPKTQRKKPKQIRDPTSSKCNIPNSSGIWKVCGPSQPHKALHLTDSHELPSPSQITLTTSKSVGSDVLNVKKPKISIFSDSHGRNLSSLISDNLKSSYDIFGSVKPNATLGQVLEGLVKETHKYTELDFIIIIGGTNDIVNGHCSDIVAELGAVMESLLAPRVLVVQLPHRYDNHALDQVVFEVNKQLQLGTSGWGNATFVSIDTITRDLYTGHGLHLSMRGKRKLARILSDVVLCPSFTKKIGRSPDCVARTTTPAGNCPVVGCGNTEASEPGICGRGDRRESANPTKLFYNSRFLEVGHYLLETPWRLHLGKKNLPRVI